MSWGWEITPGWDISSQKENLVRFEKQISDIDCEKGKSLRFPNVMHSSQYVYLDGRLAKTFGSHFPPTTLSIYGAPALTCEVLSQHKTISWEVFSPINYFSKIRHYPWVSSHNSPINTSDVSNLSIIGGLFVFTILLISFSMSSPLQQQGLRLAAFSFFMAVFFISSVAGFLGLNLDYLLVDKIACVALGFATFSFISFLEKRRLINKTISRIMIGTSILFTLPIPFLGDGDQIQILLSLVFLPAILGVWIPIFTGTRKFKRKNNTYRVFPYLALASFAMATTSDIFYTFGVHSFGFSLGYGVFGCILFFTAAIQLDIRRTYRMLEHLKQNLQSEVSEKTKFLTEALEEKKQAQAELIQNAKLASLGTLSAGLAHEINNSINYVNGAIIPLEKLLAKVETDQKQKELIMKLLKSIKEGSAMTVDIVRSLRNYTGLNQARQSDMLPYTIAEDIITILRNKLGTEIKVINKIPSDLSIHGNKVSFNQILMNLISNASDAISGEGTIYLSAEKSGEFLVIHVKDDGPGMPDEIKSRIFDPFFTTKEVGKGTGLGLHIVQKEVSNQGGKISVESSPGKGTKFTISIPIDQGVEVLGVAS